MQLNPYIFGPTYTPELTYAGLNNATFSLENGNLESLFQNLVNEQKAYNKLQMEREDSAYQRMVADMKKAGLNPWSAVSSGGLSSSSLESPSKSAFSTLISALNSITDTNYKTAQSTLNGISVGAKIALGLIGLFI